MDMPSRLPAFHMLPDDLPADWPPEHRLWMSVIKRAVLDYLAHDVMSRDHQQGARRWLASDRRSFGSLWWIAENCTTDADYFVEAVRGYVKRMAEAGRRACVTVVEPL